MCGLNIAMYNNMYFTNSICTMSLMYCGCIVGRSTFVFSSAANFSRNYTIVKPIHYLQLCSCYLQAMLCLVTFSAYCLEV